MNITKEQLIYGGVGLFVLLVLINSTRKVELKEVKETKEVASFDNSSLPPDLQPPYRMAEGESIRPIKKNLNIFSIGVKPRFDT
jgi:hypothetical protein